MGFVEEGFGFGCGYVSFIVKWSAFVVLRPMTKPISRHRLRASETDTWPTCSELVELNPNRQTINSLGNAARLFTCNVAERCVAFFP
jgi:hypothetical protein